LTTIAHAAKRHWNYPEAWIRKWREQLTVTPAYTDEHRVFLLEIEGAIGGFYALRGNGSTVELDHLWVDPGCIGRGLGRRLLEHALAEARGSGSQRIEIDSDPHAESFYEHLGARRIGKTAAPVDGDAARYLPRMVLEPGTDPD
jgi:GNAT superfamily N-acetyltransferase